MNRNEMIEAALKALVDYCQTPAHAAQGMTRAPRQSLIDNAREALAQPSSVAKEGAK